MLATDRLNLRNWIASDYAPFYGLNSDPETMRYFPSVYSKVQSDRLADKCRAPINKRGWGLWAVCKKTIGRLLVLSGYISLILICPAPLV
ncbi:GNAT family N-acetyltransferase [Paraglaciecola polaris]|uniref:GNAT family N-acetyltransferase n=1 Tax=Paraglaciecola polaris TaxID=222814 RepID=UPI003001D9E6